ncbi:MAG: PEP-CTERM system TPR-repeat protein PrsT [Woeseiaceae bacterium]|nr:PEP-CTERM system TPR-repeat protein PrsT [Woeseiaceae bacterium]
MPATTRHSPLTGSPAVVPRLLLAVLLSTFVLATFSACGLRLSDEELVARATAAAGQDDFRAAIIDLKTVLQRDPQNLDARVSLGRIYLQAAEPYDAEKELRKAVELGVPRSDVLVSLGEALLAQGAHDLVLGEIDQADAPDDAARVKINLIRGDAELALGRVETARQQYVAALENEAENPVAYLGIAATYLAEGHAEQALVTIERAIELAPDFAPAWMARGAFRLGRQAHDVAEQDFLKALELAEAQGIPAVAQSALASLADIQLFRGDITGAADYARRLERLAPGTLVASYTTARVAFASGEIDRAVGLLQQILKEAPDFRQAHFLFGAVSRAKGNLAQAEMYLSSVVSSLPDNVEARKLLADVRLRQHKVADAADALGPILDDQSLADGGLLAAAGLLKLKAGDEQQGVDLLRRSVDADPADVDRKMDLAAVYLAVGQTDQAIALLESLADSDADEHRLEVLNVVSLQRSGDVAAARQKALELAAASNDNPELYNVLGGIHEQLGDLGSARDSFLQALALDNTNVAALLRLGQMDVAQQRYADARLRYRRALQIAPDNVPVILQLARLGMLEGDVAGSVSWLEKARDHSRDALMPRIQLATHYLKQNRLEEALRVAQEAVQIDESDARSRNLLGVAQMATSDLVSADRSFSAAIRLDPEVAAYRFNYARLKYMTGDQRTAMRLIRENFAAHPYHVPSATQLAEYLVRDGQFDAAVQVAEQLRKDPANAGHGYALYGDILAAAQRHNEAIEAYARAIAIAPSRDLAVRAYKARSRAAHARPYEPLQDYLQTNPGDARTRMLLAEGYHASGETKAAAAEYEKLLQSNPDNVVALNNLAWILLEDGDPRAIDVAAAAYELVPDNGAIADTYGWVLLRQGQPEAGLGILEQAAASTPGNPEIHYHLGVALYETGNAEAAYSIIERVVAGGQEFASRDDAERLIKEIENGRL